MPCSVCLQAKSNPKTIYDDCIVEFLEKIKAHYLDLKSKYNEQQHQINKLQTLNCELVRLKSPKRRKTSSFEESPALSDRSSNDCLNDAIKHDSSYDDSFFVGTQPSSAVNAATPSNVLKLSNKSPDHNTPPSSNVLRASPGAGFLPRRLRGTPVSSRHSNFARRQSVDRENKSPQWTSKEKTIKMSSDVRVGIVKRDQNMSFIQPAIPPKVVNHPRLEFRTKSPLSNVLSLKKEVNLKQSRLKFECSRIADDKEETIVPDTDATFCADLIAASPTSLVTVGHEAVKPKPRTTRKLNRQRIHPQCETTLKKSFPTKLNMKIEPQSAVKKAIDFDSKTTDLKPIALATPPSSLPIEQTISGIERHSDASVCIVQSQPDDVIIVDDTHLSLDIESDALLGELMKESDETSDFLRGIEKKSILSIKHQQDKQNEIAKSLSSQAARGSVSNSKDIKLSVSAKLRETDDSNSIVASVKQEPCAGTSKIIPKWNCKECESYYALAGKNMLEHELFKRMQHCVENHKRVVCETPEGFWNPCFAPTQDENDSRYQTQVDSKMIEKRNK